MLLLLSVASVEVPVRPALSVLSVLSGVVLCSLLASRLSLAGLLFVIWVVCRLGRWIASRRQLSHGDRSSGEGSTMSLVDRKEPSGIFAKFVSTVPRRNSFCEVGTKRPR